MRYLPMRCVLPLIVGFERATEVDNRRIDSMTVLGVGKRPISVCPTLPQGARK
jgi:hypothetical protein